MRGLNLIAPILLFLISPIAILLFAIRRSYRNKDFSYFHYMLIFTIVRYFGTISGIGRKVYTGMNVR